MRTLKYGGRILPGDFVAISCGNYMDFGWYCGNGVNSTLQYYSIRSPHYSHDHYERWLNDPDKANRPSCANRRFEKGFTIKHLYKSYINSVHPSRVIKITNPEEIFTEQEEREMYEKSKKVLTDLNFIKH